MMVEIDWREPEPAPKRPYTKVQETLDLLEANPGKWGMIATYKSKGSAAVACVRWRQKARLRGDGFQFASRLAEDGERGEVFARFIPATVGVVTEDETVQV